MINDETLFDPIAVGKTSSLTFCWTASAVSSLRSSSRGTRRAYGSAGTRFQCRSEFESVRLFNARKSPQDAQQDAFFS